MKKMFVTSLALCLFQMNASASLTPDKFEVPAECKKLALMQGQLITTSFHNGEMGNGTYAPSQLTLKVKNALKIGKIEYLGGDSEDESGPNVGQYPCELEKGLCTAPGDAGGAVDWARVTLTTGEGQDRYDTAEVVVSMGGRGGCVIDSAKTLIQ